MDNHQFKIISSNDGDVYRIIDLTDTALVGITEMFDNDDKYERSVRAEYNKEIKANVGLRARIVGYGIFVSFDDENTKWNPSLERSYLLSVLKQMALFFEQEVVNKEPGNYIAYRIPQRKRTNSFDKEIIPKKERKQAVVGPPAQSETGAEQGLWYRLHPAIRVVLVIFGGAAIIALAITVGYAFLSLLAVLLILPGLKRKR